MTAEPNEQGSRRIELVVWRGELETLALRLRMRPEALFDLLGCIASDRARQASPLLDLLVLATAGAGAAVRPALDGDRPVTTEQERLLNQSLKRVEIVVWSGSLDCLAFRLGMSHAELITALTRTRDMRRGTVKIEITPPNAAPIFAAAKRALLRPPDGEPADALLHLADARW